MATTHTVTLRTATIGGNPTINTQGSETNFSVSLYNSSFPTVPCELTSAKIAFTLNNAGWASIYIRANSRTGTTLDTFSPGGTTGDKNPNLAKTYNYENLSSIWFVASDGSDTSVLKGGDRIIITLVYTETTSACGAPTSISVSSSIAESSVRLSWTGATAGTGNSITGYDIYARDSSNNSSWGSWSLIKSISSTSTSASTDVALNATRGNYRQYSIVTKGSAGSSYYSAKSSASASVRTNRLPNAPTVLFPGSAATYSTTPYIKATAGTDPDGQTVKAQYRIGANGTWTDLTGATQISLSAGAYTLYFRTLDALGAASTEVTKAITVSGPVWTRGIAAGDVIADANISHRADITEMLSAVNTQRAWYGLTAESLPVLGPYENWQACMHALETALDGCRTAAGLAAETWPDASGMPRANVINAIREGVEAL